MATQSRSLRFKKKKKSLQRFGSQQPGHWDMWNHQNQPWTNLPYQEVGREHKDFFWKVLVDEKKMDKGFDGNGR